MSDRPYLSKSEAIALRQSGGARGDELYARLREDALAGRPTSVDGKPVAVIITQSSEPPVSIREDELPEIASRFGM